MNNKNTPAEPELSRPLRVEKISSNGVEEIILANAHELQALAKRFELVEVQNLEAKLSVMPRQAGMDFEVTGKLMAGVVQRCVVSLEPLPAQVEQTIHVHFTSPALVNGGVSERALDEDDMEPIVDGIIDLGELVAQHLGLGLNPYPRKPDLPPVEAEFGQPLAEISPFAKLVALKDRVKE